MLKKAVKEVDKVSKDAAVAEVTKAVKVAKAKALANTGPFKDFDDLRATVLAVTEKARLAEESPKSSKRQSELVRGLLSVWDKADFGCQRPHVAEILRVIVKEVTAEDIKFPPKRGDTGGYTYPRFAAVVPLGNINGHDYAIGKAFLTRAAGRTSGNLRSNGTTGNNFGGGWRYAADEEIDDFFNALPKTKLHTILSLFEF